MASRRLAGPLLRAKDPVELAELFSSSLLERARLSLRRTGFGRHLTGLLLACRILAGGLLLAGWLLNGR